MAFCFLFLISDITFARSAVYHPDGKLGRIGGQVAASYTSVSAERGVAVSDLSRIEVDLVFPCAKTFTFKGSYELEYSDSLFHNFSIAAKKYSANPVKSKIRCNPDGKIGAPIFSFGGLIRIADSDPKNPGYRLSFETLVPISTNLSLGAGANYYYEDKPEHTDDFFGIINFYPARYTIEREYENPDGVDGIPSFAIRAGGSEYGFFGQLAIIVPLRPSLSIGILLRGEKLNFQETTKAALGVRINFYPGN